MHKGSTRELSDRRLEELPQAGHEANESQWHSACLVPRTSLLGGRSSSAWVHAGRAGAAPSISLGAWSRLSCLWF